MGICPKTFNIRGQCTIQKLMCVSSIALRVGSMASESFFAIARRTTRCSPKIYDAAPWANVLFFPFRVVTPLMTRNWGDENGYEETCRKKTGA